ncbi:hypothetical protein HUU05_16650 [candidate division KSB1 bacterium]|nr:hypothetical protein [candidate division KSB1 bacterium]
MRVLIIPEDPTNDQYVLKPIIAAIFADLGRKARVNVLQNPRLRSVNQALDPKTIEAIIVSYPQENLFLLLLDRDCEETRIENIKMREKNALSVNRRLLGGLAIEEIEMWALAVYEGTLPHPWQEMRRECHPKEEYFEPLIAQLELNYDVGRGRKHLMRSLPSNYSRLLQLCPEVSELRARIKQML